MCNEYFLSGRDLFNIQSGCFRVPGSSESVQNGRRRQMWRRRDAMAINCVQDAHFFDKLRIPWKRTTL